MNNHPLKFHDRVVAGAVCWVVLLLLFCALMPNPAAAAWVYVFVSSALVFRFVLTSKLLSQSNRGRVADSQREAQPETRAAFIDRLLAESEHEAQAIATIRERNPEIAEEIHDIYRQKMAINSQEDQP